MFLHERKIFLVVRNQSGRGGGGTARGWGWSGSAAADYKPQVDTRHRHS